MKRKTAAILLGLAMVLSMTGCGETDSAKGISAVPDSQEEQTETKEITVRWMPWIMQESMLSVLAWAAIWPSI